MSARDAIEELQARAVDADEEGFAALFDKAVDVLGAIADLDPHDDYSVSRLHRMIEDGLAPDLTPEQKKLQELRTKVAAVITDVKNFPDPAQAPLLGQDLNKVITLVTEAAWGVIANSATSGEEPKAVWEFKITDGLWESNEPYFTEPELVWDEYGTRARMTNGEGTLHIFKRRRGGNSQWFEVKTMPELFHPDSGKPTGYNDILNGLGDRRLANDTP